MKAIDIHEALVDEGYEISYSTVCNYVREKKNKAKEAYIRQEYDFGEVVEFDWGHLKLNINGKVKNLHIAIFTTAKSSYRYAYIYPNQKMKNFLDAHVKFINHEGGVYKIFVYDNIKQAVKKFVNKTKKIPTEELLKLSLYYGFNFRFCNICSGNEKVM
ncbi:DDE-type integrase/transposase/recombinase [Caldisalinibacter kiritimatiensis]|uniref:Putative transposase protein n=1 Tax=Caldisalinibacter kiritimatiensis TaxID=1304284 RepID=R1CHI3_9FIRM|nr:DDE-type integrase/transposase/recombinase [Caldisalinibacter kiritimatiensis]EOD01755.1 Putative transposase protein [Caldisalinibacter kiritimatiensis]